ncbi:DUF4136 domain-containing protein [Tsuneonella sp. YG55]|uniref:DUF4136 domain-containing protein n=1 Tax=Tsuneonella litorea TaxID=2976475 RepID=A0A9X3ALH1_9SPHN|nr:DUF4136 domain-containing protein [Tsuneonella litorea]MCT2559293.1 DUF4136 domain-containing protein [Tsuneonella litorea]
MSILTNWGRTLKLIAVPLALGALAACATPFKADVQRFQSAMPAPQGQTFAVVAEDPALAGGLEFAQYADYVEANMTRLGYTQAATPENADLLVRFDYGVDKGRERVRRTGFHDPFYDPWYGYGFGRRAYWPYYGRGFYSRGFYGRGPWSYGFYDPFFDNGLDVYTVYTSGIEMKIDNRATGQRLFEGKAEALSTSNRLQYLVPNLVEAMFTDFPGRSGEVKRISIAPENMPVQRNTR